HFLADARSPALERVLVEREDTLELLRRELTSSRGDRRLRILDLLGRIGDPRAVPRLERLLVQVDDRAPVIQTLGRAAAAGSRKALSVLVEALPAIDQPSDWDRLPDHE